MDTSDLAKRMKDYEMRDRYFLQKRIPVAIRVDMRAGHTFTRGFKRPFDNIFMKSMQETAKYMCENMGNAKFAYIQSDEITIILVDYDTLETDCWFNYRTDKLCSIAASMATMAFNKYFEICSLTERLKDDVEHDYELGRVYKDALCKGAMFDARCFNIPKEEVTNLIYWRQLDASRNSIQMVGQANFSHKELQHKSCNNIQDMLMTQKGINWNDLPTYQKRGSCCVRNKIIIKSDDGMETAQLRDTSKSENEWIIDTEIPIFKGEGREYIDRLVFIGEE
ncbi:MAG: tRNA(His) guanylyltransferase Thg1 family protein [Clostridium sp.]|nr:tRNA(His) guanylyltransferase Thg1 family protein [Clostridium sp.]